MYFRLISVFIGVILVSVGVTLVAVVASFFYYDFKVNIFRKV